MVVAAAILGSNRTGESTRAYLIGHFSLKRSPRTGTEIDIRANTVTMHAARNDIDDAPHRIAAIKHRGRATEYFHTLGHHRLIAVGYRMTIDSLILRMTVDENHQLSGTTADAAEIDAAGSAATDAIAHHTTGRGEKARHLL